MDPEFTPENFTVLVGERWVATLQTKEYSEVAFYAGFHEQLPSLLSAIFPYRLAYALLFGETENYIGGLVHESFHTFQGNLAPERLEQAESVTRFEGTYPWKDAGMEAAWKEEMDSLVKAVRATEDTEAQQLAKEFLTTRQARRASGETRFNYSGLAQASLLDRLGPELERTGFPTWNDVGRLNSGSRWQGTTRHPGW